MARDLRCLEDLSLFAEECQSELEELEQDNYHVLIEETGSNLDDPERGLGLASILSNEDALLASIPSRAEEQLGKDDRNAAISAKIVTDSDKTPRLEVQIQPSDPTLPTINLIVVNGGLLR